LQTVSVELGSRAYPIHVGNCIFDDPQQLASLLTPYIRGQQVAVFTNETVSALYGAQVLAALEGYKVDVFKMGDGEQYKTLETYCAAMDFLMAQRHSRTTCLLALGGGVVGDLTGFVAATYQRGVDFLQIPTTLLAQVDSSVGGKTAVNHPAGKNMIGAFYQPRVVVIDAATLNSLPPREYAAGLAEVVKYGVIADADLFSWLEGHVDALLQRDADALGYVIKRSCEIKADVVAQDETEAGIRAILNFGHTFGHAIENLSGYGTWLHGEAVAVGMVMAARFSEMLQLLQQGQAQRLSELLAALSLPVKLQDDLAPDAMLQAMGMDKKAADGKLRFVVTTGMGSATLTDDFPLQALHDVLAEFC
jgi:3-dehydroquinate synthase